MKVHVFDTTEEAYDRTQCDDSVNNGDVLAIPSEKVIGLADTWPMAVTVKHGALHTMAVLKDIRDFFTDDQVDAALQTADKYGFPVVERYRIKQELLVTTGDDTQPSVYMGETFQKIIESLCKGEEFTTEMARTIDIQICRGSRAYSIWCICAVAKDEVAEHLKEVLIGYLQSARADWEAGAEADGLLQVHKRKAE